MNENITIKLILILVNIVESPIKQFNQIINPLQLIKKKMRKQLKL